MKQYKFTHRVVKGFLAFAVSTAGLPLQLTQAAETIPALYRIQLQSLVNQHGIVSEDKGNGVYDFALLDISGDGNEELFVLWKNDSSNMTLGAYSLDSGNLETLFTNNSLLAENSSVSLVQTDMSGYITGNIGNSPDALDFRYGWHNGIFQDVLDIPWGDAQQGLYASLQEAHYAQEGAIAPNGQETASMTNEVTRSFEDHPSAMDLDIIEMLIDSSSETARQTYSDNLAQVGVGEVGSSVYGSNVDIDFQSAVSLATGDDLVTYLGNAIASAGVDGVNDAAKSDLVNFIETAISQQSAVILPAENNAIRISSEKITESVAGALQTKSQVEEYLNNQNVALNKAIGIEILLQSTDVSMSEALQVTLDQSLMNHLDGASLKLMLEDGQHGFHITNDNLNILLMAHGEVTMQLHLTETNTYSLQFLDMSGNVIPQINASVGVTLPATDLFSTVIASFSNTNNNWGGQFNSLNDTITFQTPYSGSYVVISNSPNITDISPVYSAELAFMVSKGFFSIDDNGNFRPTENLTRYDFTEALVRMFFALETGLSTSYTDLSTDSPYYDFVASSEAKSITAGYLDGTFRGDNDITTEEVLTLVARTLSEKKGYIDPDTPDDYLNWVVGASETGAWASTRMALAIREGIVLPTETLLPASTLSRENAAVYLYRLFMLLEELDLAVFELRAEGASTPPVIMNPDVGTTPDASGDSATSTTPSTSTDTPTATTKKSSPLPFIIGGVVLLAAAGGGGYFFLMKRKGDEEEEEVSAEDDDSSKKKKKEKKSKGDKSAKGKKEKASKEKKAGKGKKAPKEKKGKKGKKGKEENVDEDGLAPDGELAEAQDILNDDLPLEDDAIIEDLLEEDIPDEAPEPEEDEPTPEPEEDEPTPEPEEEPTPEPEEEPTPEPEEEEPTPEEEEEE